MASAVRRDTSVEAPADRLYNEGLYYLNVRKSPKEAAKKFGLKTCPVTFGERADFHRSSAKGEVAAEIDATGKAAAEAKKLWNWVRKQVS